MAESWDQPINLGIFFISGIVQDDGVRKIKIFLQLASFKIVKTVVVITGTYMFIIQNFSQLARVNLNEVI